MQQRYYDPVIGRFYSEDPAGFETSNPMMFNRYAYVNNNPYKYTDPDGRTGNMTSGGSPLRVSGDLSGLKKGLLEIRIKGLQGSDLSRETRFYMNANGDVFGVTQNGCDGTDSCVFDTTIKSSVVLMGHIHVYDPQIKEQKTKKAEIARYSRDMPGHGDANPLKIPGMASGIITPGNYRFLITGSYDAPIIKYLGGGKDKEWGKFVEDNWKKDNESLPKILAERYLER